MKTTTGKIFFLLLFREVTLGELYRKKYILLISNHLCFYGKNNQLDTPSLFKSKTHSA